MNSFNPSNPNYRRGVSLFSVYACTIIGVNVIMSDFGSQEHVFSPVHRYVYKKMDTFFDIQTSDIAASQTKRDLAHKDLLIFNADLTKSMGGSFNGGTGRPQDNPRDR